MRKRCHGKVWVPMPPRGLRAKLTKSQMLDLALSHHSHLDTVAKGEGTETTLWQLVGAALTWSKVAELLQAGTDEMRVQLEIATSLIERYGRTGRVVFTGQEYQRAKAGLEAMDDLAEIVDLPTAVIASEWAEAKVNELERACKVKQMEMIEGHIATLPARAAMYVRRERAAG
jgi:hypothetical protein